MTDVQPQGLGSKLELKKHVSFFLRCLGLLPQPYVSADDQRMTLGYFALSGLDLLNALDKMAPSQKMEVIEWVYEQQSSSGGFRGSPSAPLASSSGAASCSTAGTGLANVAMTYSALLILAILRDDFTRLDRTGLLRWIGALQDKEGGGGFAAEEGKGLGQGGVDREPRFTYCAIAICSMLGEWDAIDVVKARKYLEGCQRYDGGFGASQDHEAHAGMTYCCTASLHLLESVDGGDWERREETVGWIARRQVQPAPPSTKAETPSTDGREDSEEDEEEGEGEENLAGGFQGRPSKLPPDVCYSFWNGAALSIVGQHGLIDAELDAGYVLSAQSRVGGISKVPGDHPDLLHSYLGLASLSLHQSEGMQFGMKALDAAYNCSVETKDWIKSKLTKP